MRYMARDIPKGWHMGDNDMTEVDENSDDNDPVDMLDMDQLAVFDSDGNMIEEMLSDDEFEAGSSDSEYTPRGEYADHSIFKYSAHAGDIFACALSPDGRFAATGGEDERLYIFDTAQNASVLKSNSFKDSVTMTEFSKEGTYVAAGDMDGNVVIWKNVQGVFEELHSQVVDNVKWLRWHPEANLLLAGGTSLWTFDINSYDIVQSKVFMYEPCSTDVGQFMPDGKRAAIGYDDGSAKVVDLASGNYSCKFPSSTTKLDSIISLAVHPDNDIIAVGSISSRVAIFKTQPPKFLGAIDCVESAVVGGAQEMLSTSVESLQFGTSKKYPLKLLVAGTDSAVHIIEYQKLIIRSSIKIDDGLTRLIWPEGLDYILVATKRGPINIYNPFTMEQMSSFTGHSGSIFDISYSRDKKRLISAGEPVYVRIFNLEDIKPYVD